MVCQIKVCGKSHPLNEEGVCFRSDLHYISVHCTRRVVFPTLQLCFRCVMMCACSHMPNNIIITDLGLPKLNNFFKEDL